jgi:hypothetical protein
MRANPLPDDGTASEGVFVADRRRRVGIFFDYLNGGAAAKQRMGETERTLKRRLVSQFENLTAVEVLEPSL